MNKEIKDSDMNMTDQERFNAAVMNWISESSSLLYHAVAKYQRWHPGTKKIIADACQQCWDAYGRDTTRLPPKLELEKKNVPTLGSLLSDVQICHANGWVVGDILVFDLGAAEEQRVRITGFGESSILVRQYDKANSPEKGSWGNEYLLLLRYRDWNREPQEPKV